MKSFIQANWPAPDNIKAFTSTRTGGISQPPYSELNLGDHVGDDPAAITANRLFVKNQLQLTEEPIWLQQTHSTIVCEATPDNIDKEADASFTHEPNRICTIMTADCLPILFCNQQGTHVAAAHAGWRGLANGIIETTLKALNLPPEDILVWLGPAISAKHFEVGDEVKNIFEQAMPEAAQAFSPSPNQRWLADLYELARLRLRKQNISQIYGGEYCTYSDKELFYSYRRDAGKTGRMASFIWIKP
jgi:YfiH family protein